MTTATTIQLIQSILAPALMISGCGLILLALLNRYSIMQNRIRLLNNERRKLHRAAEEISNGMELPVGRVKSLDIQIDNLFQRVKMIHNALMFVITGILFFVLSSLAIAAVIFAPSILLAIVPLIIFLLGMISLLIGVLIAGVEIRRSFANVWVEVNSDL
jgi:ABC-type siderophore export system fused ATPase/permease subunit